MSSATLVCSRAAAALPPRPADRAAARVGNVGRRCRAARIVAPRGSRIRQVRLRRCRRVASNASPLPGVETMIGGGSGRTAGADAIRGVIGMPRGDPACATASCARGGPSLAPRRRSIAARARSLASTRSSGAMAASTGGAAFGAATTGAATAVHAGCTGSRDGPGGRLFAFHGAQLAGAGAYSAGMLAVLRAACQTDFSRQSFSQDLLQILFAARPFRTGRFSKMAFSEMPFALTPASGRLATFGGGFRGLRIDLEVDLFRGGGRYSSGDGASVAGLAAM